MYMVYIAYYSFGSKRIRRTPKGRGARQRITQIPIDSLNVVRTVVGFIKLKFGICISKCCYCAVAAFFGVSKLVCETDFCPEIVSSSFFGAYIDGDESERADLYKYMYR